MIINLAKKAQIKAQYKTQVWISILLFDEVHIAFLKKCSNYSNIFLVENIAKLSKNSKINKYIIKLEKDK